MKNPVIFLIVFAFIAFSSCTKVKEWFGGKDNAEELQLTNLMLKQKIREDSLMHLQELNMLREQYEKEMEQLKEAPKSQKIEKGYYVIVGSFKNPRNAEKYASEIKSHGYEGRLIDGQDYYTLVTSGTYTDFKQALEAYRLAREKVISTAWVYVKR